mgnify:FL=1
MAAGLRNATNVWVPNQAHGVLLSTTCTDDMLRRFLRDPAAPVDLSCLQGPSFDFPQARLAKPTRSPEAFRPLLRRPESRLFP